MFFLLQFQYNCNKPSINDGWSSNHLAISGAFYRPPWTLSKQMFGGGRQVFQVGQAPSGPTVIRPLHVTYKSSFVGDGSARSKVKVIQAGWIFEPTLTLFHFSLCTAFASAVRWGRLTQQHCAVASAAPVLYDWQVIISGAAMYSLHDDW